jgi:hypothetical protein
MRRILDFETLSFAYVLLLLLLLCAVPPHSIITRVVPPHSIIRDE